MNRIEKDNSIYCFGDKPKNYIYRIQSDFFCTLTSSGADHPAFVIAPDKIDKFLSSDTYAPFKRAMERFISHGGIVNK